ncbi:MAG TPA: DUF1501 domain-containing protein, partial [Pirellulaceae bacterium]
MDLPASSQYARRHFLKHALAASSLFVPALTLTQSIRARAEEMSRRGKAAILLWLSGGPSTIDLWDLKPGSPNAGPFRPIPTTGSSQICEHLPRLARQMRHLSVVRSMSTREADHTRGRYLMQTGYPPTPGLEHPSYGAVFAHELAEDHPELRIPPFVSIGDLGVGPGFLGMSWAPFVVTSDGRIENLQSDVNAERLTRRMTALRSLETEFIKGRRGPAAQDHALVLDKTLALMTSPQLAAFQVEREPVALRNRYGDHDFGKGCLLARRLVEAGVPFVEVDFGGWDHHNAIFPALKDEMLPRLDQGFSALIEDLEARGLLPSTAVICMGEFGRTPRINTTAGRDHWARAWSVVVGGAGFQGGKIVGETNDDGTQVTTEPHASQDLMASVCRALDIPLTTTLMTPNGRPMKIANSG